MQFNDLRVSGPGNSAQGSLNLSLSGTGATNANAFFMVDQPGMTATTLSSATIAVSVTLSEEFFPFTVTGGEASFTQTRDSNGNVTGSLFDSGQISIPLNFASTFGKYQLKILLHSYVDASYSSSADNVDLLADALSDYSHTLTFPASGPVFNLPAGYTANSPDAHIVNNMFVPEPGSLVLLVSAGSLIWSGAHRGRRRPSRR
jgi:hypothetical protein